MWITQRFYTKGLYYSFTLRKYCLCELSEYEIISNNVNSLASCFFGIKITTVGEKMYLFPKKQVGKLENQLCHNKLFGIIYKTGNIYLSRPHYLLSLNNHFSIIKFTYGKL